MNISLLNNFFKYLFVAILTFGFFSIYASTTNGTIDLNNKKALLCSDGTCNAGTLINFGYYTDPLAFPDKINVHVTDTELTGYAIGNSPVGWISLNCKNEKFDKISENWIAGSCISNYKVINDGKGNLSGWAWGENTGWINFNAEENCDKNHNSYTDVICGGKDGSGTTEENIRDKYYGYKVQINNNGEFTGLAWSQNFGYIKFNCSSPDSCVKTDWRQISNSSLTTGSNTITPPVIIPSVVIPPVILLPVIPVPPVVSSNIEPKEPPAMNTNPTSEPGSPNNPNINDDNFSLNNNLTSSNSNYISSNGGSKIAITQVVLEDTINSVEKVTTKVNKTIFKVLKTKEGDVTTKLVAVSGAVSGISISVATVLFANPLSFSELFFIPFRLWSLLLIAFGLKKRNLPWGTVYDSVTKQPLDPVYVILKDLAGNEVATSITDLDGRYGFLVPAGKYTIEAKKTNYEFPSKKLKDKEKDELYQDLYFADTIELLEGGVITKNIPMDPLKFDWNEFTKKDKKLMKFFSVRDLWISRVADLLFYLGMIISLVALMVLPVSYNIIIVIVYLLLFILKRTILRPRAFGYVKQIGSDIPLPYAIVRVYFTGSNDEFIHKVADKTGKYYCLIPNGDYYTKIENKNIDESYSLVHTSELIKVEKGYLNKKFKI